MFPNKHTTSLDRDALKTSLSKSMPLLPIANLKAVIFVNWFSQRARHSYRPPKRQDVFQEARLLDDLFSKKYATPLDSRTNRYPRQSRFSESMPPFSTGAKNVIFGKMFFKKRASPVDQRQKCCCRKSFFYLLLTGQRIRQSYAMWRNCRRCFFAQGTGQKRKINRWGGEHQRG